MCVFLPVERRAQIWIYLCVYFVLRQVSKLPVDKQTPLAIVLLFRHDKWKIVR